MSESKHQKINIPNVDKITNERESNTNSQANKFQDLKPPDYQEPKPIDDNLDFLKQLKAIAMVILMILLFSTTVAVFAKPSNHLLTKQDINMINSNNPSDINTIPQDSETLIELNDVFSELQSSELQEVNSNSTGKDSESSNDEMTEAMVAESINDVQIYKTSEVSNMLHVNPDQKFTYIALAGGMGTVFTLSYLLKRRKDELVFQTNEGRQDLHPETSEKANNAETLIIYPSSLEIKTEELAYIGMDDYQFALAQQYPQISIGSGKYKASASIVGNRDENQDYLCSFDIEQNKDGKKNLHVMVVADGCGGHKGGKHASCLAVRAATETIINHINDFSVEELIKQAFEQSSQRLERIGSKYWNENELRTTLIITIATDDNYYVGWIGDGGVMIKRDNKWFTILEPHKAGAQNLLAASLGPKQYGQPSFAKEVRKAGDMFLMGSDGVFDVIEKNSEDQFWSWFENQVHAGRSPQTSLEKILDLCTTHSAFDDNLTVAYLGTSLNRKTFGGNKQAINTFLKRNKSLTA